MSLANVCKWVLRQKEYVEDSCIFFTINESYNTLLKIFNIFDIKKNCHTVYQTNHLNRIYHLVDDKDFVMVENL